LLQSTENSIDGTSISFSLHPLITDWLQLRMSRTERQTVY
jgi:hypothetical protein